MDSVYVIIADRSQLVRIGITGILYQAGIGLVVKEVSHPDRLIQALKKDQKGLLIISHTFLSLCNPEILSWLRRSGNKLRMVLISDYSAETQNNLEFAEMLQPDDSERTIYQKIERCLQNLSRDSNSDRPADEISHREKEVLKHVALGLTNKEIADRLYISLHTVITHRKNITAKLGIKTIAGLTVYAILNKLISTEDIKST